MADQALRVSLRAGRAPGERPAAVHHSGDFGPATVTLLADVSEFQLNVGPAYFKWSPAIIFRAMYGTRVDKAWYSGERRAFCHSHGAKFVGMYQYVVAGEDVGAQARALVKLVGKLRKGEKLFADIEEGSGSQQARWVEWANIVNSGLHNPPWDYSGLNFAATHGLQPVTWVAAYGTTEPGPSHQLWQFTDRYKIPGITELADCSVYHGSVDELASYAF